MWGRVRSDEAFVPGETGDVRTQGELDATRRELAMEMYIEAEPEAL